MDEFTDDDPVLRALGEDLERDDPALAALLSGRAPERRHHPLGWALVACAVIAVALVVAPGVTLGVLAMLLVLASPLVACWWCALPGDGPAPRHP
jgi:hypothetical protein